MSKTSWFASSVLAVAAVVIPVSGALAQSPEPVPAPSAAQQRVAELVEERASDSTALARQIWEWAEVGYRETRSSGLLQRTLSEAGFTVEAGVAEIPTAFVASYGSGEPVIAFLAEFDALPGVSQTDQPARQENPDHNAGHACGHHLLGAGATAAALSVAQWLEETGTQGTIRVYGTPAEEGGSGKVYMVRAGLFEDVDTVFDWHPSSQNSANIEHNLANRSARFQFHGQASHAAGSPERGRSALDGVEAMNMMANMLREHVPQESRIHYVITSGGEAPNVVPEFAEVYYYVRHPEPAVLDGIFDRLVAAAEGAAQGTETEMTFEVMHGNRNVLPNEALQRIAYRNLQRFAGVEYTRGEEAFARTLHATLNNPRDQIGDQATIQPFEERQSYGSTDVGDVSWAAPTGRIRVATWVPGTSAHSWQAVAAGGTSIGFRGMQTAAQTLAASAVEVFENPDLLIAARAEFDALRGPDFVYRAMLGDREPPLDYRAGYE